MLPVVILAGGLATRLRPITEKIPKCLVEVNGLPFIDYQLAQLRDEGVKQVVLLIGYRGEMVRDYLGSGERYGMEILYAFDGPKLLGTAGALRAALPVLPEAFFLLYGDSYLRCSYAEVEARYKASGRSALMTVYRNNKQWDTSNVWYEDGVIKAYSKKNLVPEMNHIDYGLSMWRREQFTALPENEPYDLGTLMEEQVRLGNVAGYEVFERFYEVGSHQGLEDFAAFMRTANDDERIRKVG